MNVGDVFGWLDRNAIGRHINHDDRQGYNPPAVVAPAMDDSQFAYDNQREIEVGILANPAVMAQVVYGLRATVAALEARINKLERRT